MTINEEIYAFILSARKYVAEKAEILCAMEANSRGGSLKYADIVEQVNMATYAVDMLYEKKYDFMNDKANVLQKTDDEIRTIIDRWSALLHMPLYPDTNLTFLRSEFVISDWGGYSVTYTSNSTGLPAGNLPGYYLGTDSTGLPIWQKFPTAIDDGEL